MKEKKQKITEPRPPVVVIMGHIDHGKSTLLDYIRKTDVAAKETGGITQHLGAYETKFNEADGKEHHLTFLDTPGHEAFFGIRNRGAKVADLAVLVVSAEDGVKPQTIEALKSLRESETPFIVAINKIDKPAANVEKTKQNLAENEIYLEGYGGNVPWVAVSGLTGEGVPELLDMLVLMSELEDLSGDRSKPAEGIVIETHIDSKRGIVATLLTRDGMLKIGNVVVAGESFCPVRAIENCLGKNISEAFFGCPVRIIGWNKLPEVGSDFTAVSDKKTAEILTSKLIEKNAVEKKRALNLSLTENKSTDVFIPIVIKADAAGSLEAIQHEVKKIKIDGVILLIICANVGTVSENDVKIASAATNPLIIAFNVKIDNQAKVSAERLGIKIMTFDLIYKLSEWLHGESESRKPKIETEESTGMARVLKIFSTDKDKFVIGGKVESGTIKAGSTLKILRRDTEIGRGKIRSLQQLKSRIDEAKKNSEFGAMIESKIEPAPGDKIESFITVTK